MTESLASSVRREKTEDIFPFVTQVTRFVTPLYSERHARADSHNQRIQTKKSS
jgi:hypothetical protein